jgi:hypothetical protein
LNTLGLQVLGQVSHHRAGIRRRMHAADKLSVHRELVLTPDCAQPISAVVQEMNGRTASKISAGHASASDRAAACCAAVQPVNQRNGQPLIPQAPPPKVGCVAGSGSTICRNRMFAEPPQEVYVPGSFVLRDNALSLRQRSTKPRTAQRRIDRRRVVQSLPIELCTERSRSRPNPD